MAAADTRITQLNDVSPHGSRVNIHWKSWCHSIKEHKPLYKADIQKEAAIREETERKQASRSIRGIIRGSVEKSRELMDRTMERFEKRAHRAKACLDKHKARLAPPTAPPKPRMTKPSTTTLTEPSLTSLPSNLNRHGSNSERESIQSSLTLRADSTAPLLSERSGSNISHGSGEDSSLPSTSISQSVNFYMDYASRATTIPR